jgi:WD40 repeat protein/serine/threonine protein kinase
MGVVYKSRQIRANRIVAVKMILAAEHARPEDLLRFRTEAEAPARLRHPNIIQIFEVSEVDNRPYFSMEFADRLSLADKLQRNPLPPYPAAAFVSLLADAIHYAHTQGVIHRDLKPANVLLQSPPGNASESHRHLDLGKSGFVSPASNWQEILGAIPKIADFGLARKLDDPGHTRTGMVMGTPSYMAPEQAKGLVAGPSADVHALGTILYELLTGRPPFVGKSLPETLLQVQKEDPVPVHRLQPTIPRDLETICLKCLEKEPQRRYASARDLASDLRRFQNDEAVLARPPSLIYQWSKFAMRNKLIVTQLAGLIVVLALGVVLASLYGINESRQRNAAESNARQTEAARQIALAEAYEARVLAAQSSLLDNDPGQAARHLEAAPESFRGWEWWHLQSRLDETTSKLDFTPELKWPSALLDKQRCCVLASGPRGVLFWDTLGRPQPISLAQGSGLQGLLVAGRTGPCLFIGGPNVPLRLVDEQGKTLRTFSHSGAVYHVALHAASDLLAVCFVGESDVVYFFDIKSGQQIATSKGNGLARLCMTFRPDGLALASGDVSGNVITWNPRTQTEVGSFLAHNAALRSIAYSSDGQRLLTASNDQTFRQFEATTGKLLETRYLGSLATAVRYSPDRQTIATAGVDRAVRIWSANGGEPLGTWLGHTSMITDLAYNADGTELATVGTDAVRLWQLRDGAGPRLLRGHNNYVYPVVYSPDGRWIASGGWDNAIRLWDAASAKPMAVFRGPTSWIAALAFSPDGSTLYSRSNDATIRAWSIPDGRETRKLRIEEDLFPAWTHGLAISPDGTRLFLVHQRKLVSWDLPALSTKTEIGTELNECRLMVNHGNGREAAVVERVYDPLDNDEVLLVDLGSKQIRHTLRGHRGRIHAVAFSPRDGWLATAGEDQAVRIWNCDTGDLLHTMEGHFNEVFAIAIHPNGKRMATAGRDRIIRLWDPTTGEQVLQMRGHTDYVYSLAFSPNGSTLCSGSGDATVRLWDTFPISRRYPEGQQ